MEGADVATDMQVLMHFENGSQKVYRIKNQGGDEVLLAEADVPPEALAKYNQELQAASR